MVRRVAGVPPMSGLFFAGRVECAAADTPVTAPEA
jgi:hypothetical protein